MVVIPSARLHVRAADRASRGHIQPARRRRVRAVVGRGLGVVAALGLVGAEAAGCSPAQPSLDGPFLGDRPAEVATASIALLQQRALLNELSVNTVGTDVEYLEVLAPMASVASGLAVLAIEGDENGQPVGPGEVDVVVPVGAVDAGGRFLAELPANTLQNGTLSLLLVEGFTGAPGDDLDGDDDGALDAMPWAALHDGVALDDGDAGDRTYAALVLSAGFDGVGTLPGGASRIPDGHDTGAPTDWLRNDFDGYGLPGLQGTPAVREAINTPGEANAAYEGHEARVPVGQSCATPPARTPIHAVQGGGRSAACTGDVVIEGVVVADFEGALPALGGFYVQAEDEAHDADPMTSEGVFVSNAARDAVSEGDRVRVEGTAREVRGQTEVRADAVAVLGQGTVSPATLSLPLPPGQAGADALEAVEGMRVVLPQRLVVTEHYLLGRYGQITLAPERLRQPTDAVLPGAPAAALQAENDRRRLVLDDPFLDEHREAIALGRGGRAFSPDDPLRAGDAVTGLLGVLTETSAVPSGTALGYRLRAASADFAADNPRPSRAPEVGGALRVGALNVLNYFVTLDDGTARCGPAANRQACRGARGDAEFARQRAKLLAALAGLRADVLGLVELENSEGVEPLADLAAGLDALGSGPYAYIDAGTIGTDAIRVGILYRPDRVVPVGEHVILDASVDARFDSARNRPVLAQTFEATDGTRVTVAVNHLKSKGSDCDAAGDPDAGDGQGNCNGTRTRAAQAMADWLSGDPTGEGRGRYLILGDLNAYAREDAVRVLLDAGYIDLLAQRAGEGAYTYAFDGQWGRLDHALASPALAVDVAGAATWAIDADEPIVLGAFASGREAASAAALHRPDAFRASDHDPILVGIGGGAAWVGRAFVPATEAGGG